MFAIFVTVNVKPNQVDEFVEACIENGQASVREEPDCFQFEILRDKKDQSRLCFIEAFKDEQALKTHWETPHFAKMWQTVESMVDGEWDRTEMDTIFSVGSSLGS